MIALRRMLTCCVLLNLPFAPIPWLPGVAPVLAAMFLAMFVSSGFVVLSVAYATHVYSPDHAGLIAGTGAGSWSLMVALMMPVFGRLFDQHQYARPFWIATAIPVLGYFGWLFLSGNRRRGELRLPALARSRGVRPGPGARCIGFSEENCDTIRRALLEFPGMRRLGSMVVAAGVALVFASSASAASFDARGSTEQVDVTGSDARTHRSPSSIPPTRSSNRGTPTPAAVRSSAT